MNRFKKSKYIIVLFAVTIIVGVFLVTTKSSTFVTKASDGLSLIVQNGRKTISVVIFCKI